MAAGDANITLYPRRGTLALYTAGCLAAAAASVGVGFVAPLRALAADPGTSPAAFAFHFLMGAVGLLSFGSCAGFYLYRTLRRRPTLSITDAGIVFYHAGKGREELILWGNIAEAYSYKWEHTRFLGIALRDDTVVHSPTGATRARGRRDAAPRHPHPPIRVSQPLLSMRIDDLLALLRERYGVSTRGPD